MRLAAPVSAAGASRSASRVFAPHRAARTAVTASAAPPAATGVAAEARTSFKSDPSFTFAPIINGCWQLAGGHGREVYDDILVGAGLPEQGRCGSNKAGESPLQP